MALYETHNHVHIHGLGELAATLADLIAEVKANGVRIMTALEALQQFAAVQEQFNATQGAAIDQIVVAQNGLAGDIANLSQQIVELKSNAQVPSDVSARLSDLMSAGQNLAGKAQAVANALSQLDSMTPPVLPPAPEPAPEPTPDTPA